MSGELFDKMLATVVFGGVLLAALVGIACIVMGAPPFIPAITIIATVMVIEFSMILYSIWRH